MSREPQYLGDGLYVSHDETGTDAATWKGSTALQLWAPVVVFNECVTGYRPLYPEIRYRAPRDTCDPRYAACTQHRVACDCREAHMAEDRAEMRAAFDAENRATEAARAVLRLHSDNPGTGRCRTCFDVHPCPTRNLLLPIVRWE